MKQANEYRIIEGLGVFVYSSVPVPKCSKCERELSEGENVFICSLNNSIYCNSVKCIKLNCPGLIGEEHEDRPGVLKIKEVEV